MKKVAALWIIFIMLFSFIVIIIEVPIQVSAITLYVDVNGGADFTTIQDAIDAADEGDTVYVYAGTYHENIIVNKTLTLIGEDQQSIIDGGGINDTVVLDTQYITITGFTLTNSGADQESAGLRVDGGYSQVYDNNISSNQNYGIYVIGSHFNNISENIVFNNVASGIYCYWSHYSDIRDNFISNNEIGIRLFGARFHNFTGNAIIENDRGISSEHEAGGNTFVHNNIIDNSDQVWGSAAGYWDNGTEGNYWSDYTGVDENEDGIGDTPYAINEDFQDNFPLMYIYPDTSPPLIELKSPSDDSVVKAGTFIDISVSDKNLKEVEYSVNDGSYSPLDSPYDISTNSWGDGDYSIKVRASDTSGKESSEEYNFVIDSTKPTITLNTPSNNDYIKAGTDIDLIVSDDNLNTSEYSVNGGTARNLNHPFDISTNGWEDSIHSVRIYVNDVAGNENTKTYSINIDSTDPTITLTAPANESLVLAGTLIKLDISDTNMDEVTYSIDDGAYQTLGSPYNIDTFGWEDGEHTIGIVAQDLAGNEISRLYVFTTDGTSPKVAVYYPERNSADIPINTSITITFSESMDTSSVESALTVSPDTEYTLSWEENDSVLRITFTEPLEYNTYYEISVGTKAKDLIGQNLENKVTVSFTTEEKPKDKDDEFPLMFVLLLIVLAIVAVVVIAVLIASKKKQKPSPQMVVTSPAPPIPSILVTAPVQPAIVQAPQMLQVKCSQCQNILQVKDLGVAMKITCPFCSTALSVQSQKTVTSPQQPKAQQQNLRAVQQISCPKCKTSFPVVKSEGPKDIQCPSCGLVGKVG